MRLLKACLLLLVLVVLAACTPAGDNLEGNESPLAGTTPPSPPERLETSTSFPDTPSTPLETPTMTEQNPPSSKKTPTQGGQGSSSDLSQKPVVIFHQEGGFAGVNITWIIFKDGRIEQDNKAIGELDPSQMERLLKDIDRSGILELDMPDPGNFCCDFFTYTITVTSEDRTNTVSVSEADPELPDNLSAFINQLHQITNQAP